MELLGETVTSVVGPGRRRTPACPFVGRNLVVLAVQMVSPIFLFCPDRTQRLSLAGRYRTCPLARHHQRGHQIRHFLFGIGPNAGRIYLVDYGLSRYYQNSVTKKHIVDKPLPYFLGTTCYSSIKTHFLRSHVRVLVSRQTLSSTSS